MSAFATVVDPRELRACPAAGLSPTDLRLYRLIVNCSKNDEGHAYAGEEWYATQLGRDVRTVERCKKRLVAAGLIRIEPRRLGPRRGRSTDRIFVLVELARVSENVGLKCRVDRPKMSACNKETVTPTKRATSSGSFASQNTPQRGAQAREGTAEKNGRDEPAPAATSLPIDELAVRRAGRDVAPASVDRALRAAIYAEIFPRVERYWAKGGRRNYERRNDAALPALIRAGETAATLAAKWDATFNRGDGPTIFLAWIPKRAARPPRSRLGPQPPPGAAKATVTGLPPGLETALLEMLERGVTLDARQLRERGIEAARYAALQTYAAQRASVP